MKNHFISVDWGTSNFRLRLVGLPELEVVEEVKSPQGIKETFKLWQESDIEREDFYIRFLHSQIKKLNHPHSTNCQIVISGMASSSIGIRELPYASLPFDLEGNFLTTKEINHPEFPYPILLISGVKNEADVMRGEEVQIIGLNQEDPELDIIYVLPGTHSKHLHTENGLAYDFKTYITGELFEIIREHSILKDSIELSPLNESASYAFKKGVKKSKEGHQLLHHLFSIRPFDLFQTHSKTENFYYLSGLLIGSELNNLTEMTNTLIKIAVSGSLKNLYRMAAQELNLNFTMIFESEIDFSVIKGQWAVINQKKN